MENMHPGEHIKKQMRLYKLTQQQLADRICMDRTQVTRLLNGQRDVTAKIAVRLSGALDNTPQYWMGLQTEYDIEKAKMEIEND